MITESPYNDRAFNINTNPAWQHPPVAEDGPVRPAGLSPRAKAALGLSGVALAASGMFAWSQYETGQANAKVREAQIALDAQRLAVAQEQQAAVQAKTAGQETPAQKARRLAVMACVSKAGNGYGAVADCGQIYPVTGTTTLADASSTTSSGSNRSGSGSEVGLVVIGAIGLTFAAGKVMKHRSRPQ